MNESIIAAVEQAIRERGGDPGKRESKFTCPEPAHHQHADGVPSACWNSEKKTWWCPIGEIGGGFMDLARRWGLLPDAKAKMARGARQKARTVVSERVYPIRDLTGTIVAEHVRLDYDDGDKKAFWRRNGENGLGGLAVDEIPLYGTERLATAPARTTVTLTEGEKAADALTDRGILAVGTVTGAGTAQTPKAPTIDVLKVLINFDVVCWADNDPPGRAHMMLVAERLRTVGVEPRWVEWLDAPPKGDAADYGGTTEEVRALLATTTGSQETGRGHEDDQDQAADEHPDLPSIVVGYHALREMSAAAVAALVQANDPPQLFTRFGGLARVRVDERGRPLIERVTESIFRHRLERVVQFMRERREDVLLIAPPAEVVQDCLALGTWPFPPLEAVVEVPVLRPDGSVFATPGYDPETRLVYVPASDFHIPDIPLEPTDDDLAAAVACLVDVIHDFPFTDSASVANTLALMLTPVLRPAIAGQVPLALLDKPKRGTGATLLAQIVTTIAFGSATDLTTAPRDDEEWRKKITACLFAGSTIMFFDDVQHTLSSANLAAALTSGTWSDRILGKSEPVLFTD